MARDSDINRWSRTPDHGICVQTRRVRALDGDVPEPTLAESIRAFIMTYLELVLGMPTAPLRYRSNSSKFLIPVIVEGELGKRILTVGRSTDANGKVERWRIEFLGNGQQFVAEGTHPPACGTSGRWAAKSWDHSPRPSPVEEFDGLWPPGRWFGTDEEARKAALKASSLPQRDMGGAGPGRAADRGRLRRVAARPGPRARVQHARAPLRGVPQRSEPHQRLRCQPGGVPACGGRRLLGAFRCLHAGCAGVTVSDLRGRTATSPRRRSTSMTWT